MGVESLERDSGYRGDIDGLRAIAVLAVVLYHAELPILSSGFIGVDIFFVISGFLIGGIILREVRNGTFSLGAFYARRVRRILPALLAVISFVALVGIALFSDAALKDFGTTAAATLIGVSNIKFAFRTDYFGPEAELDPLLMTWSLGVEEQFYLLFPLLLVWLARAGKRTLVAMVVAAMAISLLTWLWLSVERPQLGFFLLPSRAWELSAGVLLAALGASNVSPKPLWVAHVLALLGLIAILVAATAFSDDARSGLSAVPLAVIGTAALLVTQNSIVSRALLTWKPLRFVGLISYSWYLWHWPLICILRHVSAGEPTPEAMFVVIVISFALAAVSWLLIERTFRKRVHANARVLVRYASVLVAFLSVTVALRMTGGWSGRLSHEARAVEALIASGRGECLLNFGQTIQTLDCLPPIGSGMPTIALLGDSHAAALGPGLSELARRHGAQILHFTKSACKPMLVYGQVDVRFPRHSFQCGDFWRQAVARIRQDPSIELVVISGRWRVNGAESFATLNENPRVVPARQALREGLGALLDDLHDRHVLIVGDVAELDFDPARRDLIRSSAWGAALSNLSGTEGSISEHEVLSSRTSLERTRTANALVREVVSRYSNVGYLDLAGSLCTQNACRYRANGRLLYFDTHHLSVYGSAMVWKGARHSFGANQQFFDLSPWVAPQTRSIGSR